MMGRYVSRAEAYGITVLVDGFIAELVNDEQWDIARELANDAAAALPHGPEFTRMCITADLCEELALYHAARTPLPVRT